LSSATPAAYLQTPELTQKTVDQVLGFAAQRTPWAIFGFSKELETLFAKNAQDFGMAVEKRKREWAEQARVQPKA